MRRLASLSVVLAVAVAALVAVPLASAAKPRLYSVSLSGKVKSELTRTKTIYPQDPGCTGTVTRTDRFVAAASLSPARNAAAIASYGRLLFLAKLTSPTAAYSVETEGGWAVDPSDPYPPDPSACAFTPEKKNLKCAYNSVATRRLGGPFALLPNNGRYELYYNLSNGTVRCEDDEVGASLLEPGGPPTKLRVNAVKGLRKGRSVSVSGTLETPPAIRDVTGGEKLDYTLKVKRVR
jgi:hypothetical protein